MSESYARGGLNDEGRLDSMRNGLSRFAGAAITSQGVLYRKKNKDSHERRPWAHLGGAWGFRSLEFIQLVISVISSAPPLLKSKASEGQLTSLVFCAT